MFGPEIPIRVYLPNGEVLLIHRLGLSVAVAEHPDALRVERADTQPMPSCVTCPNISGAFY